MSRAIPHLRIPLQPGRRGFAVVDQDTGEEVVQSVRVLLETRPGEALMAPRYGVDDPTFAAGGIDDDLVEAIRRFEPRATEATVRQAAAGGRVDVTVEIGD